MKFFSCAHIWLSLASFMVAQPIFAQQLNIMGTVKLAPRTKIGIFGDISNNGTFIDSSFVFVMAGNMPQTISGDSIFKIINLRVNNSSTGGVILNQALEVSGLFILSDGVLHTADTALLSLNDGVVVVGGDTASHVAGPMVKIGIDAFTFPVGKQGLYAPVSISAPSNEADKFTCEYFDGDPNSLYDVTSKDPGINTVSTCEYWVLDRTAGTSPVEVTLSWDSRSCLPVDPITAKVVRWDGSKWKDHGNGSSAGTTDNGRVTSNGTISNFSPFTIGSSGNVLPIGLLWFEGNCINSSRIMAWATASEVGNDYFTIETSYNGADWTALAEIDGQGNSTTEHVYNYNIPPGTNRGNYFRLKQTDWDGQFSVSEIIYSESCLADGQQLSIYPNPTNGFLNVRLSTGFEENIIFTVSSLDGSTIKDGALQGGVLDLSSLPPGYYICRFQTPAKVFIEQVILSK